MELVEHLLVEAVNRLGPDGANMLVHGVRFVAQHYNDLLAIIRWTFPCLMTFLLLLCFLVTSKKAME